MITLSRGATMYEFQVGPAWVTWCFLIGGNWKWWNPRGRLKMGWDSEWGDE